MGYIDFQSVSKHYQGRSAVADFTVAIDKSERLVILGHSGCGKTTVLRLLAGFLAPDAGTIRIGGEVVSAPGRILKEPGKRGLGMVFQDLALWPHLTVKGNLEFGLRAMGVSKRGREERIATMLKTVRMEDRINARPAQLSGGEQQRVALARALVLEPVALLMDEPLSNLNIELNVQLRKEILRLHEKLGFTLLYVTHNRDEAFEIGTRVLVMEQGRIEQIGAAVEVREYLSRWAT